MISLKLENYLYLFLLISIFLKIKIYPFIMVIFIFFMILNFINVKKIKKECILIIFLLVFSIGNYIFIFKDLDNFQYILKLTINFGFLLSFFILKRKYDIKKIITLIKILIILTFIQILIVYYFKDINLLYFFKINNSSEAYLVDIDQVPFLFAAENKNIWSTKILFLEIIFMFYSYKNNISNYFFNILIILNCLLLTSRTGYLALLIFIIFQFFLVIIKKYKKNRKVLIIIFEGVFFTLLFNINLIFQKFLRIDFNNLEKYLSLKHDGGVSRITNWIIFLKYFDKTDFLKGIGIGNTQKFLLYYGGYPDGNMHNFIFNTFLEQGIIIGIIYILFHYLFIKKVIKVFKWDSLLLLVPFYAVISLQYLGYDNDIVIYISLVYILIDKFKEGEKC